MTQIEKQAGPRSSVQMEVKDDASEVQDKAIARHKKLNNRMIER